MNKTNKKKDATDKFRECFPATFFSIADTEHSHVGLTVGHPCTFEALCVISHQFQDLQRPNAEATASLTIQLTVQLNPGLCPSQT